MPARPAVFCAALVSVVLALSSACGSDGKEDAARKFRKSSTTARLGSTGSTGTVSGTGSSGTSGASGANDPAPTGGSLKNPTSGGMPSERGAAACARMLRGEVSSVVGIEVREVAVKAKSEVGSCSWTSLDGAYTVVELEHASVSAPSDLQVVCEYLSAAVGGAPVDPTGLGTRAFWSMIDPEAGTPLSSVAGQLGVCTATGAVAMTISGPIGADVIQGYARQLTQRFLELLASQPAS